jgi:hypothetical protein
LGRVDSEDLLRSEMQAWFEAEQASVSHSAALSVPSTSSLSESTLQFPSFLVFRWG